MKKFCKKLYIFIMCIGISILCLACDFKKDDIVIEIFVPSSICSVEIDKSVELLYSVNVKNSLVTFQITDRNIFDIDKRDGKTYIVGKKVGKSKLLINAIYGTNKSSVEIDVVVFENIAPDDKDDPNINDANNEVEAGDEIVLEMFGANIVDKQIIVDSLDNGLCLLMGENIDDGEFTVFIVENNVKKELEKQEIYFLPYSESTYKLVVKLFVPSQKATYVKEFDVIFHLN